MSSLSNKDFDRKFRPIFRELKTLELKINKKQGWFIFKTHCWTEEELLNSEQINKIYSISEKIGDDVENWKQNKQLSKKEQKIYEQNRDKVEDELELIQQKIIAREETFWESLAESFGKIIPQIMNLLPEIVSGNLALNLLGNVFKALLPGGNRNNRRLPASR